MKHQISLLPVLLLAVVATSLEAGVLSVTNHQAVGPTLGLDPAKTYLHKLDFPDDGTPATVNGVTFSAVGIPSTSDPATGNPFSLAMNNPLPFAAEGLLGDFIHNGGQNAGSVETLTLGGFVPGTRYEVRLYYRNFGPRANDVTIDTDGVTGPEYAAVWDQATSSDENFWAVQLQADTPTITIRFSQQLFNNSWHQYAATSELLPAADNEPVTIVSQPQSQTVREGGQAVFRVSATGSQPMLFQWFKGSEEILDATNMVLVLNNLLPADAGSYTVLISNGVGDPVTSQAAVLTVGPSFGLTVTPIPAITLRGIPNRSVTLLAAPALSDNPDWQTITNVVLSGGERVVYDWSAAGVTNRFYRGSSQ